MPLSLQQMALSGPIPGESLTQAPGNRPYEKPSKYNTVDDAMHAILQGLQDKKQVHQLLALLEGGTPVDVVVQTIIMHGFGEGMFTPSLGMLLIHPLVILITGLAKKAGIKHIASYNQSNALAPLLDIVDKNKAKNKVGDEMVKKFQLAIKAAPLDTQESANITSGGKGFMTPPSQPGQ